MKIVALTQGSPEWHAHRATHFNASDAPAMLGVSPYKSRAQLLREYATGVTAEVDAVTQRRFDDGHRFEALARPFAEAIIGEELYPCVGVDGGLSASFDGLTLLHDTAFEHKTLNDAIRTAIDSSAPLPEHLRVQMEQQCVVSGAERVLFMASKWDGDELVEERHCWYYPDADLRARIVAGWAQFARDLEQYEHQQVPLPPPPTGRAPEQLPALRVEVTGMVTASNLAEFKASALAVLGSINRDLRTDEDFADAEKTVKWCKGVEDRLAATKDAVLAQTADIDAVFRAMDEVAAETRRIRLELDKLVKAEKESRKAELVAAGVERVRAHYAAVNASLGEQAMAVPGGMQAFIASAIKGLKSLSSMRDAIDAAVAQAKIEASQQADAVRANVAVLADFADHAHLFADRVQLCASKAPDDLRNLAMARVAEHQQREAARLEAERERIREQSRIADQVLDGITSEPDVLAEPEPQCTAQVQTITTGGVMTLSSINARISPLCITADGLATLGFEPSMRKGSARIYREADFSAICRALAGVIAKAATTTHSTTRDAA